jgi:hypothetical protein
MNMMMVMMPLPLTFSLPLQPLPKLTTRLMPPQIIQPREPPFTTQVVKLAQHMLMLGPVRGHVALKVAALAIEVDAADWAEHLVAAVVRGHVLVADVLVLEGFGAVGECAFEGAFGGGGMQMVFVFVCGVIEEH